MPFDGTSGQTPRQFPRRGELFAELVSRWRTKPVDVEAFAREAQEILDRYEEQSRSTADRVVIDARVEAARILTAARHEIAALSERIETLRQARPTGAVKARRPTRSWWTGMARLAGAGLIGATAVGTVVWLAGMLPQDRGAASSVATVDGAAAKPAARAASPPARRRPVPVKTARARAPISTPSDPAVTGTAGSPPSSSGSRTAAAQSIEQQILRGDREWFDAFYTGDRAAMMRVSAPGLELVDSRTPAARPPAGKRPDRRLTDIRIDVHGDGAVLSARMVERLPAGERAEYDSFLSEVWVRRDGAWRLLGVRLAGAADVRRAAESLR